MPRMSPTPWSLLRRLTDSPWETTAVVDALHGQLAPRLGATVGVFVFLETGFPNLIDMRLYLPQAWTNDNARCQEAGVP